MAQITLVVAFSIGVMSCVHDHNDEPEVPVEPEIPIAGRTVLVYMLASGNGLGASAPYDYDMQDISEMRKAAAAGDITDGRLLIFHSSSNGNQILKEITEDGTVDTLKIYDSAIRPQTAQRMSEVLDDMKDWAPAADYGMILWGHGTGWIEDGIAEEAASDYQTYSYGSEQNNKWKMNVTSLANVLEGRNLGFIYFDCCYMASVEVIYQLRKAAPRIVAYPTEVLAWGMPYDRNIKHFFAKDAELVEAATNTFDYYASQTSATYRMCTVSVFRTAGMERLASATRAIYQNNTTGVPENYSPQSYTLSRNNYYCDFGGYVNALKSDNQQLDEFKSALAEVVELELATEKIWNQLPINEHSGFSTFIMDSNADVSKLNYSRLDWFDDVASALIH
ncbi:MAG: hypothetical protein K2J10_12445 [Muribaculaceae bacterium]|nr:hypothetical protein [Muribaculaceae bacterium]